MNIVMFMDGVIRGGFGQPLRGGVALYKALVAEHRLLLIGTEEEADKHWLAQENLTDYATLTHLDPLDVEDSIIWRTLSTVRSRGRIDLIVIANPALASECFTLGYETMLYVSPAFARPVWRPDARKDTGPTPWQAFMEEVRNQKQAAAAIPPVPDE
jgi:hypothetical protein